MTNEVSSNEEKFTAIKFYKNSKEKIIATDVSEEDAIKAVEECIANNVSEPGIGPVTRVIIISSDLSVEFQWNCRGSFYPSHSKLLNKVTPAS